MTTVVIFALKTSKAKKFIFNPQNLITMSQKSYFKTIAFLGLFFIPLRTLLAIAPHKTGVQIAESSGTYSDAFWAGFGVTCIFLIAGTAFWMVQGEKSSRYDQ